MTALRVSQIIKLKKKVECGIRLEKVLLGLPFTTLIVRVLHGTIYMFISRNPTSAPMSKEKYSIEGFSKRPQVQELMKPQSKICFRTDVLLNYCQ